MSSSNQLYFNNSSLVAKRSDNDWATYLGCSVSVIQPIRKWLNENFMVSVCYNWKTKKYSFVVSRKIYGLNNDSRWLRWRYTDEFDTKKRAIEVGTEKLIPNLEFPDFMMAEFQRFWWACISIALALNEKSPIMAPRKAAQLLEFKGKGR